MRAAHPIHPMLVHAPITCWLLAPACDFAALATAAEFFWRAGALLSALGVIGGALAATAGAMDMERARLRAQRLVFAHAGLMGAAWVASLLSLLGRVGADGAAVVPAPLWSIAAGLGALILMLVGAWCGGEMVYGRGVGVRAVETDEARR